MGNFRLSMGVAKDRPTATLRRLDTIFNRYSTKCCARFAANVLPIIRELQEASHESHHAIAKQRNARNVGTARGGRWTHVQVGKILARAE
jgi:hypothetical protein